MEELLTGKNVNWKNQTSLDDGKDSFTADELIDAFFKGRKKGLEYSQQITKKQFVKNIQLTTKYTSEVVDKLPSFNLNPINAYLRLRSIKDFDVLITLPEKDVLSDSILDAYNYLGKLERSLQTDSFTINFSISSYNNSFNEKMLALDGYALKSR